MFFSSPRHWCARRMRAPVAFSVGATMLFTGVSYAQHDHAMPSAPPSAMTTSTTSAPGSAADRALPLQFESVLSRYKPMTVQKLGSWREANDTVTRIGGWRSYLKESQTPDAPEPTKPSVPGEPTGTTKPATSVAPNPHAGHGAKP